MDAGDRSRTGARSRGRRLHRAPARPRPRSLGHRDRCRVARRRARWSDPRLIAEPLMSSRRTPPPLPSHADVRIEGIDTPFSRFLRIDVVRFRHKLFSGEWSGERVYDVLRRGEAVAIILYDPERDSVALVEQFRLPALYAGLSPWQIEPVAGLVDEDESYEAVARRESQEEAGIAPLGELVPIQRYMPSPGDSAASMRAAPPVFTAWPRRTRTSASSSKLWPNSKRCSKPARSRPGIR